MMICMLVVSPHSLALLMQAAYCRCFAMIVVEENGAQCRMVRLNCTEFVTVGLEVVGDGV